MNFRTIISACIFFLLFLVLMGLTEEDRSYVKETAVILNKAKHFFTEAKIDSAQLCFKRALQAYSQKGDKQMMLECTYYLARIALQTGNYEAVHVYAREVDHINSKYKLNHPLWFDCQYFNAVALLKQSKFDKAYKFFNDLESEIPRFRIADSTLARYYSKKGASGYYKGDIFNAIKAYSNAVKYGSRAFGESSMFISDQVNNLGVMNFMLNRFDEALGYYLQSEKLLSTAKNSDDIAKAGLYTNIGLIFKEKQDYDNAIQFFEKAKELYLKNPDKESGTIAHAYVSVAAVYHDLGQYDKQFSNLLKSKEYSEKYFPQLLPRVYFQLAYYYESIGNIPMGYKAFRTALAKANELFGESADLAYAYSNLGEFCISNNYHFAEALPYLKRSLAYFEKARGTKNPGIARNYLSIGEYFEKSDNLQKALLYYHQAVISCVEDFSTDDVLSYPHHTNSLSDEHLIDALKAKASVLKTIGWRQSSKRQKYIYLEASFRHYLQILRMTDKIRDGFITQASGLILSAHEQYVYHDALNLANSLHALTNNAYYAEKAFLIADKAHAAHLQSMMQKKDFPKRFEFADSLFVKEYEFKKELNTLNEFILREKSSKWCDSAKIVFWNEQIADITAKLKQLQGVIIRKHPFYQHLTYTGTHENLISDLRKNMTNEEAIIEYFCTDSTLFSFCLLKDNLTINKQVIGPSFFKDINDILVFLNAPKYAKNDSLIVLNYRKAANKLYRALLASFSKQIINRKLVFIPNYKLNNLPFSVLLTSSTEGKILNFKELPYLIKQNPIRYLYAAHFFNVAYDNVFDAKILAFAPVYENTKIVNARNDMATSAEHVASLNYNAREVELITQSGKDRVFKSSEASEANFKKYAHRFGLIHLAMHAIVDDENPNNSRLVFTPYSSSADDDLLYSYETYNLKLNTDLLVLSACKTGTGKMQKGEGLMSLTRGFIFSGVKSIVTSLWTVNDKSGAEFFGNFYKNLTQDQTKSVALQQADLNYLQSADNIHAHPYYWAGFVLIGCDKPVHFATSYSPLWVITGAMLALIVLVWFALKRKRRKGYIFFRLRRLSTSPAEMD